MMLDVSVLWLMCLVFGALYVAGGFWCLYGAVFASIVLPAHRTQTWRCEPWWNSPAATWYSPTCCPARRRPGTHLGTPVDPRSTRSCCKPWGSRTWHSHRRRTSPPPGPPRCYLCRPSRSLSSTGCGCLVAASPSAEPRRTRWSREAPNRSHKEEEEEWGRLWWAVRYWVPQ